MADISKELDNFKNAKYGKDVRGSMVSLAEKLNKESSDTVKTVSEYGDAEASREQAEQNRQNAENARRQDFETMQSDSQTATTAANEAAERAEQAATGDMSLKTVTFEVAAARAGIVSGDTLGVAFGKLAKYCTDIEDHAFNALVNNGLVNIAGVSALDAVQANPDVADTLAYKIAQNLAAITSLNSNLTVLNTKGTVYEKYNIVDAIKGASSPITTVELPAGNYMIFALTSVNSEQAGTISCALKESTGRLSSMQMRGISDNGGGLLAFAYFTTTTKSTVTSYGYGYNSGDYKYQSLIIAVKV